MPCWSSSRPSSASPNWASEISYRYSGKWGLPFSLRYSWTESIVEKVFVLPLHRKGITKGLLCLSVHHENLTFAKLCSSLTLPNQTLKFYGVWQHRHENVKFFRLRSHFPEFFPLLCLDFVIFLFFWQSSLGRHKCSTERLSSVGIKT